MWKNNQNFSMSSNYVYVARLQDMCISYLTYILSTFAVDTGYKGREVRKEEISSTIDAQKSVHFYALTTVLSPLFRTLLYDETDWMAI